MTITLSPAIAVGNLFPNGLTATLPSTDAWTYNNSGTYYQPFGGVSATILGSTFPGSPFSVSSVGSACTAVCTCDRIAEQSSSSTDYNESIQLCQMVLGAATELGSYRTAFLKNFNFVNLFPTVYFDITQQELLNLANGEFSYPIEKMQQMLAFFDAYKFNRNAWNSGEVPEPHWQTYYQAATIADQDLVNLTLLSELSSPSPVDIDNVLIDGILAHVKYDLPRALRYSFANEFQNVTIDNLYPDFIATNQTFYDAAPAIASDINNAAFGPLISSSITRWAVSVVEAAVAYCYNNTGVVIVLRQQAWNDAFNVVGNVLLDVDGSVLAPQPITDHEILQTEGEAVCPGNGTDSQPATLYSNTQIPQLEAVQQDTRSQRGQKNRTPR